MNEQVIRTILLEVFKNNTNLTVMEISVIVENAITQAKLVSNNKKRLLQE